MTDEEIVALLEKEGWEGPNCRGGREDLRRLLKLVRDRTREACARACDSVNDDMNRESRHEPLLMRCAAGAAMCARKIREAK